MSRIPVLTLLLVVDLLAVHGCGASVSGFPPASFEAQSSTTPLLERPPGSQQFRLTVTEHRTDTLSRRGMRFQLDTALDGIEMVTILELSEEPIDGVERGDTPSGPQPIECSALCRAEFGGGEGAYGRFSLTEARDFNEFVPPCVAESVFGLITDAVSFLLIQRRGHFGIEELREPGDAATFPGFEVTWNRPPTRARASSSGGTLTFEGLEATTARLTWCPEPMELAMVRSVNEELTLLMAGTEVFRLEIIIDAKTGELLEGRSVEDVLDLSMWIPYTDSDVPGRADWPTEPGRPVKITRHLELARVG